MARFAEQVQFARNAHKTVNALEDAARLQIEQAFDAWDAGHLNAQTVRHRLEKIVRVSYRGSVALAVEQVSQAADIPGWKPRERIFLTPYLKALLEDIRANLRAYKADGKTDVARRRAILRMKHSAGVAAQRGYTDALVAAYSELQEFGLELRKIWMANYENGNVPCATCNDLHGSEVGISEQFPVGESYVPYMDLVGPPAHPHCRCWLAFLVVALENAFDSLDIDPPEVEDSSMTSAQVRSMPVALFNSFVKFVTKVVKKLRKK